MDNPFNPGTEIRGTYNFYSHIDTSFLDDFDVKAFERGREVDEMLEELRVDAYIRFLEGQLRRG